MEQLNMMKLIGKTQAGFDHCLMASWRDEYEYQCKDCPYFKQDESIDECRKKLRADANTIVRELARVINDDR